MNQFKFLQQDPDYYYYNTYHNETDWTDYSYDEAFVQNYSLNVQGGDEIANYNLSVGYAMGDAIAQGNDYSRFNLRLNSDISLTDKLNIRFDASYSDVTRDLRDDGAIADIDDNIIAVNPGSLAYPRQEDHIPTYAIMEVDRFDEVHFTIARVKGN